MLRRLGYFRCTYNLWGLLNREKKPPQKVDWDESSSFPREERLLPTYLSTNRIEHHACVLENMTRSENRDAACAESIPNRGDIGVPRLRLLAALPQLSTSMQKDLFYVAIARGSYI